RAISRKRSAPAICPPTRTVPLASTVTASPWLAACPCHWPARQPLPNHSTCLPPCPRYAHASPARAPHPHWSDLPHRTFSFFLCVTDWSFLCVRNPFCWVRPLPCPSLLLLWKTFASSTRPCR